MPWLSGWWEFLGGATRSIFHFGAFYFGLAGAAGDFPPKPALAFSLTATNQSFSHRLGSGLILRVERDELGCEVECISSRHGQFALSSIQLAWSISSSGFGWSLTEPGISRRAHHSDSRTQEFNLHSPDSRKSFRPVWQQRFSGGRVEVFDKPDASISLGQTTAASGSVDGLGYTTTNPLQERPRPAA